MKIRTQRPSRVLASGLTAVPIVDEHLELVHVYVRRPFTAAADVEQVTNFLLDERKPAPPRQWSNDE